MEHPYPPMTPVRSKQGSTPGRTFDFSMTGFVSDSSSTSKGYRYNIMVEPEEWNRHSHRKTDRIEVVRFYDDELEMIEEASE